MRTAFLPCLGLILGGVIITSYSKPESPNGQSSNALPAELNSDLAAIHRVDWTDWRKVLAAPSAIHDVYYGPFVEKLKRSAVPTEREAENLAIGESGAVDMRTIWRVSALFRLAQADKELGAKGDFVWEVRVILNESSEDIAGLIWIGATTGKAKVLYQFGK